MTVAELFVSLGVKGSEKTVGAITSVKKGLGETASMSLEAKAGILAAMYALERLFATSGAAGTGLTNFNAVLGVSAKTLQQYQYAARQMGVSNQEMEGTFKSLQGAMSKTLLGEGAPKGMARVAMLTGGITPKDIENFAKQPQLLIQKLAEYAQKEKNVGLRNEVLKSFNISDAMVAAMTRGGFSQSALSKAPVYSDKEIGTLDRANIAWANLGNKIEMAVGHFNAKHGGDMVRDISKITDQVLKLVEAFTKLAEKMKLFTLLTKSLDGITKSLNLLNDIGESTHDPKKRKELEVKAATTLAETKPSIGATGGPIIALLNLLANDFLRNNKGEDINAEPAQGKGGKATISPFSLFSDNSWRAKGVYNSAVGTGAMAKAISPKMAPMSGKSGATNNFNVKQDLHFQHDGKDHKKTADSTGKATQDALRQFPQGQVN